MFTTKFRFRKNLGAEASRSELITLIRNNNKVSCILLLLRLSPLNGLDELINLMWIVELGVQIDSWHHADAQTEEPSRIGEMLNQHIRPTSVFL